MPVVNLYFVRHGETDYNVRDVLQGQCDRSKVPGMQDLALNEKGIEQALALCGLLKERKDFLPDIVLSSDLLRARQTAQIIADAFGIKVVTDKGVREMFFGADNDGLSAAEFKKKVFSPPITYFDTEVGKDIALSDGATLRKILK